MKKRYFMTFLGVFTTLAHASCDRAPTTSSNAASLAQSQLTNPAKTADNTSDKAKLGYDILVNDNYIGCGIPLTVMKRAIDAKAFIPAPVMQAFFPTAASDVFVPAGIPGRNSDNAKISPSFNVFTTARGIKAINFNCISCHGDLLGTQFVVGVGNRNRDYTQDLRSFTNLLPTFAQTDAERAELAIFRRSMDAIAPYVQTKTIGANPAVNLTYALFANRNSSDFTWSDSLTLDPPEKDFPPVDVPPWWRMKHKTSMFYNGEFASGHHRVMMLASALCIKDSQALLDLEPKFKNVEAYIKSIEAPRFPLAVNAERADRGKRLYNRHCANCHGTYSEQGTEYQAKLIPIDIIDTDRALMEQQTGAKTKRFRNWGEALSTNLYGQPVISAENRGYIAPSLNGIWATAPYLHNGSVPTLDGVINSRSRPKYWQKTSFDSSKDYDVENMSVHHRSLDSGQQFALPLTKRYIYDTTIPGYGNGGHRFGDLLLQVERNAILEYLKTL